MTQRTPDMLLDEVLKAYTDIENARHKQLLTSVVRHLFAFANDASLTREDWRAGTAFLRQVGEACSDTRDEFILLSDILGLSALVELSNGDPQGEASSGSLIGPFHVGGSPFIEIGGTIDLDSVPGGQTVIMRGRVMNTKGEPLSSAVLDIWQTAPNQQYAVQDEQQSEFNLRGKQRVDSDGRFAFKTVRPVPYSIPRDGPCGKILDASKRHGMRAAHIHLGVDAPGYVSLVTEVFDFDDPYNVSDTVFGACDSLLAHFEPNQNSLLDAELSCYFDIILKANAV